MKVAILWTRLSGYLNACLKALVSAGSDIWVAYETNKTDAPFESAAFSWLGNPYRYETTPGGSEVLSHLNRIRPEVVLVSSWHIAGYRYVLRHYSGTCLRVLCMDNQWMGTLKQFAGVAMAHWYIRPYYDIAFLPGERQAIFARKLGFSEANIWRGLYTCDHESFIASRKQAGGRSRSFAFVGRLCEEKGVDTLINAYQSYRNSVSDPWALILFGEGPLKASCAGPGVQIEGFCQPRDLPPRLAGMGCFVLASRYEPWGVAIHEAASAGLPIICSSVCGASVHLVMDGYNGFIVSPDSPEELAQTLRRVHFMTSAEHQVMSDNSLRTSYQFTPGRWAQTVLKRSEEALKRVPI